jgi:PAS domain S-box-containing protein
MKWLGIRSCLFVIMSVLTAIPVFLLGSRLAEHLAEEVRRGHDESLTIAARGVSWQLQHLVEARTRDLEAFTAAVEMLGTLSGPTAQRLLENHWHRSQYYQGMYLADAAANVQARVPTFKDLPPGANNYADRDYYKQMLRDRSTAIGIAHVGKALGKPGLQMASPIFGADGTLIGFVEGTATLDPIVKLVDLYSKELPESRVFVIDAAGNIVADSAAETRANGLISTSLEHPFGQDADTQRYHAQARISTLADWKVVASLPRDHVERLASRGRNQVWLTSGLVWLVSLVLSALIAHGFGKRFSGLAATVKALGEGDFSRRPPPQKVWEPAEVGILVSQVDSMAARLQQHTTELGRLVSERTGELARVNDHLEVLVNALERAGDGIEISDPSGRYLYVNPAVEKITGYTSRELLGNFPSIHRSGQYDNAFYENIQNTISAGNVYSGSFTGKRKDGSLYDQEVTVWPVQNAEGTITHVVGLRRDITERRKTEHALRVSERMASVGTLAAGVAHEINNPLTYVLLSLRLLERDVQSSAAGTQMVLSDRSRNAIAQAIEGAERVQAIVKDLRSFSRANDESVEAIDVKGVLESALRMVSNDIRHRGNLRVEHQPTPKVLGNPSRLSQVFLNLLVNAAHSLHEGNARKEEVVVFTRTDDAGNAVIEVADTGKGIAQENLSRVFDPFFTTKPIGEGTGLGLSMCHNIVSSMRGSISVESTLGKGTTFTITLPPAGPHSVQQEPIPTTRRMTRPPKCSVLLVDDDRAVAAAIKAVLDRHSVTVVHNAAAALAQIQNTRFDVILCDIMMPGTNGLELYDAIRERGRGEESRVIFITGGVLTPATRSFLDQTKNSYLEKPVSETALEQAIFKLYDNVTPRSPSRSVGSRVLN